MKKIIFALLFVSHILSAQNQGLITFEEKTKLQFELPPEMEQYADKMPSENVLTKLLYFNEEASIYKNDETKDESQNMSMGNDNMQFKIKFTQPYEELYHAHSSGEILHQQEFMTRTFLVDKQSKHLAWKMDMEQKEILGYVCQKATFQDTANTIEAWFTPQIAISGGPAGYGGLPGMILEVSLLEPEMTITATSVELEELDDKIIQKPKKGKKVSEAEFDQIMIEKQKEMEAEHGGRGNRIIIRN